VGCALLGCQKAADPKAIADAGAAYESATKLYLEKNYQGAATAFADAIAGGVLNIDSYCLASIRRAECLARLGDFPQAHQILEKLEEGAPNMADVHITRCFVYEKEGKSREAGEQFRLARKYDRAIQRIPD
jgi:tetratricopeptide (TPR) repeat protein